MNAPGATWDSQRGWTLAELGRTSIPVPVVLGDHDAAIRTYLTAD